VSTESRKEKWKERIPGTSQLVALGVHQRMVKHDTDHHIVTGWTMLLALESFLGTGGRARVGGGPGGGPSTN
jgi:hypothetical protein